VEEEASEERGNQLGGLIDQDAGLDLDPRGPQPFDPLAAYVRAGVLQADDDPRDPGVNQVIDAWGGFALMATGLERYVNGRFAWLDGAGTQGLDFRVRASKPAVIPFADDS
jgi:hypothetical protein